MPVSDTAALLVDDQEIIVPFVPARGKAARSDVTLVCNMFVALMLSHVIAAFAPATASAQVGDGPRSKYPTPF